MNLLVNHKNRYFYCDINSLQDLLNFSKSEKQLTTLILEDKYLKLSYINSQNIKIIICLEDITSIINGELKETKKLVANLKDIINENKKIATDTVRKLQLEQSQILLKNKQNFNYCIDQYKKKIKKLESHHMVESKLNVKQSPVESKKIATDMESDDSIFNPNKSVYSKSVQDESIHIIDIQNELDNYL